jgi:hypothetical protein
MSQIFHRSSNALVPMTLFGVVVVLGLAGWITYEGDRSNYVTRQNQPREQPVPFSHAHHVGGEGFDCRYCHTSVENSSFAGLPPTQICMNCHSQIFRTSPTLEPVRASYRTDQSIRWTRVHDLPDFVYFNHSIHVAKGVGCTTCHGAVDEMPLMRRVQSLEMQWCLDCHRHPEANVRPRELVFDLQWRPDPNKQIAIGTALVHDYGIRTGHITNCSDCHR